MKNQSGIVNNDELIRKLRAVSGAVAGEKLLASVKAGCLVILNAAKENIKKQGLIKTRTLSRSVHEEVGEASETRAAVDIGTNLEYAAIHEFGGTIRAKNGKYLAIPVGSYWDSPRKHPDLKLRKTGGGTLAMISADGIVQYVLKTSVVIPAKPYMRPAYDENKNKAADVIADSFERLISKAAE